MSSLEQWERQPTETAVAYSNFSVYRDLGPARSLRKAASELGKSRKTLDEQSAVHRWVARAEAWDRAQEIERRALQRQAAIESAERHSAVANAMLGKVISRLGQLDVATLSPRDLAHWVEVAVKVQRLALGEPERYEVTGKDGGPIEVAHLSDEERKERLAALRREIDKRLEEAAGSASGVLPA